MNLFNSNKKIFKARQINFYSINLPTDICSQSGTDPLIVFGLLVLSRGHFLPGDGPGPVMAKAGVMAGDGGPPERPRADR